MKRIFFIAMLLVAGIAASNAQDKIDGNKIVQDRVLNMKTHFHPTATEAKTFWAAYEQYLRSEVKLHETYRANIEKKGIKMNCPNCPNCDEEKKCEELTDSQITYLFDQKFELKKNLLTLETNFYKKLKTMLSPKHLQEFYKIDERYKRSLSVGKKKAEDSTKTPSATPHKARR